MNSSYLANAQCAQSPMYRTPARTARLCNPSNRPIKILYRLIHNSNNDSFRIIFILASRNWFTSNTEMSCTTIWTHTDFREVIESDGFFIRFARYFRFHFCFFSGKSRKCIYIWCAFDFDYDFICPYLSWLCYADVNKNSYDFALQIFV